METNVSPTAGTSDNATGSTSGNGSPNAGVLAAGANNAGNPTGLAPTASQNFRDYVGEDGSLKPGWTKVYGAPEAFEKKFTNVKSAFGSHGSLETMIGAKGIIPPGPNATPEQKAEFYKALGRPDKPEDYGIQKPAKIGDKEFPAELWNQEQAGAFAKWAHEKGWSKQQVQDAIEFDAQRQLGAYEGHTANSKAATEKAIGELKAEWGANYDKQILAAKQAALAVGGESLLAHPLASDPAFIRAMAKVGAMTQEQPAAGARGTQATNTNPASEIAAIMGDKNHPWHPHNANKDKAAHDQAVKRMTELYKMKAGG